VNIKNKLIREACVETREEIDAAAHAGADRIELCARLDLGGLTPEPAMAQYALSRNLSVAAMIRLHDGFSTTHDELPVLAAMIHELEPLAISAFVFGFLTEDKHPDVKALKYLALSSGLKEKVFHMAFDEIALEEQFSAIDTLSALGFTRILTKGGAGKASDNIEWLARLAEYAEGKIEILCGGGVTDANYEDIARKTGISQFHGRKLAQKRAV
jgi:copper homeostasis protein